MLRRDWQRRQSLAILIKVTGMPLKRARLALESAGGFLRKAIA